ncbi:hypothetical protein [Aeromonas allosaccharophila]|uniref:hypothetical protein n=1 Tax=Aeromonas allosaccharophila TaxID=656 RepID=UPI000DD0B60B|nr:hypothetical protein [Aeromonas allosaccharophila]
MILKSDPKYPIHNMYVIKLERDAAPGSFCGRLENLVSGRQREFTSPDELCHLLSGDLESCENGKVKES